MDYATASNDECSSVLGFKDDLYRNKKPVLPQLFRSEIAVAREQWKRAGENYSKRDAEGNYLATPKEIVMEIQNIYSGSNTSYQVQRAAINDNEKLAERIPKVELKSKIMKDFVFYIRIS